MGMQQGQSPAKIITEGGDPLSSPRANTEGRIRPDPAPCLGDEVGCLPGFPCAVPEVECQLLLFMLCKQMGFNCCYCQALGKYHTKRAFWLIVAK